MTPARARGNDADVSLERRVAGLLAEVCGAPLDSLSLASTPATTRGWDSAAQLNFIAAVEEELGVAISTSEAMALRSLGDMVALLGRKGVAAR